MSKLGWRGLVGAAAALAVVGAAAVWWFSTRPKPISVCVLTDYAFRKQHADWAALVQSRFQAVNRLYRGATGLSWKLLDTDTSDPTAQMKGFDTRRAALAANTECHADVLVAITGISEGPRTGSTLAFARSALVADFPQDSEQRNAIVLAHELAHLFGAPDEPDALNTIMRTQPQTDKFSSKTVALIRQLWGYPFASGIDGLRGVWDRRAFDAITAASTGIYTNPVSHAHEVLAVSYLAERRRPAAIDHLTQAVKAEPENAGVHFDLGFALIENSQLDAALPELREAIRLSPQDARMHRQLGLTLVKLGHTPDGLKEFEEAARLDPRNPDTHSDLGACELNAGNIPAAIREFEKAIQLQPSHGVAHASLAMVFYREKEYDKAWDEVAKARQAGFEPPAPFIADLIQHKPK